MPCQLPDGHPAQRQAEGKARRERPMRARWQGPRLGVQHGQDVRSRSNGKNEFNFSNFRIYAYYIRFIYILYFHYILLTRCQAESCCKRGSPWGFIWRKIAPLAPHPCARQLKIVPGSRGQTRAPPSDATGAYVAGERRAKEQPGWITVSRL